MFALLDPCCLVDVNRLPLTNPYIESCQSLRSALHIMAFALFHTALFDFNWALVLYNMADFDSMTSFCLV